MFDAVEQLLMDGDMNAQSTPDAVEREPTICLCMMVKDESAIIERCLSSARDLIDHWVICDTGSSDDTIEKIEKTLAGISGQVHRRPWINFGFNRTEALELSRDKADYVLVLDADMTVAFTKDAKRGLAADSYMIRYSGNLDYRQRLLVSGKRSYRYVGVTHEYIEPLPDERVEMLETIVVTHHGDGKSREGKPERDLELLRRAFSADPTNGRTLFYLAQTYRDLGRFDEALEMYENRARMGGWEEEVFYSLYQVAVLTDRHGHDWGAAFQAFVRAWEFRPSRLEPVYHIVSRLRRRREYHTAIIFAQPALSQPYPSQDILFIHRWMYTYGLALEYAHCCAEVRLDAQAVHACDVVLSCKDAPPRVVAEANRIRGEARQRLRDAGKPVY